MIAASLPTGRAARMIWIALAAFGLAVLPNVRGQGAGDVHENQPAPGFNMYGVRGYTRALLIGDSMSVGAFGEAMQEYLTRKFGASNVALYGVCGISPEHWLSSEPDFLTKCGYRECTPRRRIPIIFDSRDGRRPVPQLAPKIENLIAILHPRTVIVQLGTNWMELFVAHSGDEAHYNEILDRFAEAIRSEPGTVRKIIWILPPDSSHYSRAVQQAVYSVILNAARRHSIQTVDSSRMTHYVPGRSGSDGVHYNNEEARTWASLVIREIDPMLR